MAGVTGMNDKIFRKKSVDRLSAPEELSDYVKVTTPGVWMLLSAVIVLLVGISVWGAFGKLETKLAVAAESSGGQTVLYVKEGDIAAVRVGMRVTVGGTECAVTAIAAAPVAVTGTIGEYTRHVGNLTLGEWVFVVGTDGTLTDGVYAAQIVVDSVSPLHFVFN